MKTVMRYIAAALVCLSLVLQTGCWDQKLFEQIGFVLQMGLENDQKGNLLFSVMAPVVSPEAEKKVEFLHTSSQSLIRSSREELRDVSGRLLQGGKIQLVYFSEDLAGKGVNDFLEIFFRDPENPLLANVVVVDGSPVEMFRLSMDYKDKPRPSFYINNLLQDARRRSAAPEARVYDFSILSYSQTIDPVTPIVRYSRDNVEAAGTALFSGDKMVGKIDTDMTMLLNMLMEKRQGFEYIYHGKVQGESTGKVKSGASVMVKKVKRRMEIDTSGKSPVINIRLELKGTVDELNWEYRLDREKNKKELEEKIAASIRSDSLELLEYMREVGADPVGFGEIIRVKHNRYWKSVKWKDVYRDAVINLDVKMNIESYGTIG